MRKLPGFLAILLVLSQLAGTGGEEDVTIVGRYHWASTIVERGYNQSEPRPRYVRGPSRPYPPLSRVDFTPDQPALSVPDLKELDSLLAAFRREGVGLEEAWLRRRQGTVDAEVLTKALVGRLLFAGSGVTKVERVGRRYLALRAAASAGALYPVYVFLAPREVEGLPSGLYCYDVLSHRVHQVGKGPSAAQVRATLPPKEKGQRPALYLVLTANFDNTKIKYNVRHYRYVLLDAGHVVENVMLEAAAHGLGVRLLAHFDDSRLSQALGVDGWSEAPLAVLALETTGSVPGAPAPPVEGSEGPRPGGRPGLLSFQVHAATSLRPEDLVALEEVQAATEEPPAGEELLQLPGGAPIEGTLEEAIASRRSRRRYGRRGLSTAELATLLEWSAGSGRVRGLRLYVVVSRVEGVPAGVYRYWSKERALELVASAPGVRQLGESVLGQEFVAEAPCVLVLLADSGELHGPLRAHWYRAVHLAAGQAGERVYIAAEGLGLGTCAIGAFRDGAVADLLAVEEGQWPLLLYPVGAR